ncbi:cell adhesion molecule DSCAML1-like [Dermacentor albipictus]|uniref:cell adhesion molecule DSCAML1-like n=1 Tax=Dermacentor albipictus TaxID=60249 RepID=UPI0031FD1F83
MRPLRALTTRRSQVCGQPVPMCFGITKCIVALSFTACITAMPMACGVVPGDREAVVSWSQPTTSSRDAILHRVLYKPMGSLLKNCAIEETEEIAVTTRPGLSSVTLRRLRPYTVYRVTVVAIGATTVPLLDTTFHTKGAAPDGPPRDLRHSTSAALLELLTWSEVACDLANGEIRSYHLHLRSPDPWETATHEHNATSNAHTFAHLAPFTRYTAKVFAQNDAGRSPYFASVNFTTAPFPPPQPTDLLASDLTPDSVRVSWNAPYPPHGILDHYRLLFWRGSDKSKATEITIVHEECRRRRLFVARHCYTVKGLEPRRVYRFSVRATNKGTSYSPYSVELQIKTKDSGPPRDLHVSERTEHSLRILWYAADGRNEEYRTYMVNSSLIHTFDEGLEQVSPPQSSVLNGSKEREFHLSGLLPGSTYLVCVQENTTDGFGEAACANFTTRPSIPVINRAPRVDAVDGNTVTLSLAPVDFRKGPLTAYYLLVVKKVHEVVAPIRLLNFSSAEDLHLGYYVGASFTPEEVGDGIRFVVGAGDTVGGFANPPLEAGAPYSFGWAAETNFSGETLYGYRLTAPIIGKYILPPSLFRAKSTEQKAYHEVSRRIR